MTLAQLPGLVTAVGARRAALTDIAASRIIAELSGFDGWYRDDLVTELSGRMGTVVDGAARQSAILTDGYLTAALRNMGERPVSGPALVHGSLRAGVTAPEAYERLVRNYRYLRTTEVTHDGALEMVLQRADRMVSTDVALAAREQTRATLGVNHVGQYRRVIRPELSRGGTCGLCYVAADRIYSTKDLMPIHDGCHCEPMVITADHDPGLSLNQEDLQAVYEAADGSTKGADLKRVRVDVSEHGELGPVLTDAQHHRRTARQAEKASNEPNEAHLRTSLAELERALSDTRAEHVAGTDRSQPIAYLSGRIDKIRSRLAAGDHRA